MKQKIIQKLQEKFTKTSMEYIAIRAKVDKVVIEKMLAGEFPDREVFKRITKKMQLDLPYPTAE